MSRFRYTAKTAEGRTVRGKANAAGEKQLFEVLRERQLYPVKIRHLALTTLAERDPLKKRELADFCRQAGTMLLAGIPLDTCLEVIAGQEKKERHVILYEDLRNRVRQGSSLCEAMKEKEGVFPEILIHMVHMGENGGHLGKVLTDMGKRFEQEDTMVQKLKLASLYPALLFGFTSVMIVVIFGFILPSFFDLFEGMEVPGYTMFLMQISKLFQEKWQWIVIWICALLFMAWAAGKGKVSRCFLDRIKVNSRLGGNFYKKLYTARFAGALAPLYGAGLPMVDCLKLCRESAGNAYMSGQIQLLIDKVENGVSLSQAAGQTEGFDHKLAACILVGEESSSLKEMLENISELFQNETERTLQKMITLLEPAMILIMAVVVGYVAVSVMMPIYQYYQSIG